MEAKELRIGNLINHKGEAININGGFIADYENKPKMFNDFEPIRLTKEWLLKYGFKRGLGSDRYWYHTEMRTFAKEKFYIYLPYGLWDSTAPCKYVHQLQNLYFALTGKELELNDT